MFSKLAFLPILLALAITICANAQNITKRVPPRDSSSQNVAQHPHHAHHAHHPQGPQRPHHPRRVGQPAPPFFSPPPPPPSGAVKSPTPHHSRASKPPPPTPSSAFKPPPPPPTPHHSRALKPPPPAPSSALKPPPPSSASKPPTPPPTSLAPKPPPPNSGDTSIGDNGNLSVGAQNSEMQDLLDAHNVARRELGLGLLKWDERLATYARQYLQKRSSDCSIIHSGGPYGENLAWSSSSTYFSAISAVQMWIVEGLFYDDATNMCLDGEECGHYTQMVWRNTARLGCAKLACSNGGGTLLGCSYDPPGNYIGERPY